MSKQSDAKESQGYTRELNMCGNCKNFKCDRENGGWNGLYVTERNLRCSIGGFKVNKTAVCNKHERAQ